MRTDPISLRPMLISQAYHLLGSMADAEDIVQDVMEAWQHISRDSIGSPRAYLQKSVANRSLNRLKVLKKNRSHYPGIWLPSPVPSTSQQQELADQTFHVSMGLLVLMETLSPKERMVFVLREVFDWPYESIGAIISRSETNCRQINSRAHAKLQQHKKSPLSKVPKALMDRLVKAFQEGVQSGNLDLLLNLLQEDVVFLSDGGGKVAAARNPLCGKEIVSKFLHGIQKQTSPDLGLELWSLNETVGLVMRANNGQIESVMTFEFSSTGMIKSMFIVRNPEKLGHLKSSGK